MMRAESVKTEIAVDGLRYRAKAAGSPFAAKDSFTLQTMSCILCGTHRPRAALKPRKLVGRTQYVCEPHCKDARQG